MRRIRQWNNLRDGMGNLQGTRDTRRERRRRSSISTKAAGRYNIEGCRPCGRSTETLAKWLPSWHRCQGAPLLVICVVDLAVRDGVGSS
eukprot:10207122-Heterocapsa_arctica.AAC.1